MDGRAERHERDKSPLQVQTLLVADDSAKTDGLLTLAALRPERRRLKALRRTRMEVVKGWIRPMTSLNKRAEGRGAGMPDSGRQRNSPALANLTCESMQMRLVVME